MVRVSSVISAQCGIPYFSAPLRLRGIKRRLGAQVDNVDAVDGVFSAA